MNPKNEPEKPLQQVRAEAVRTIHKNKVEGILRKFAELVKERGTTGPQAVNSLLDDLEWSASELAYWSGIPQPQLSKWLKDKTAKLGRDEIVRLSWSLVGGLDGVLQSRPESREVMNEVSSTDRQIPLVLNLGEKPFYGRPACSRLDFVQNNILRLCGYYGATKYRDLVWRRSFETSAPQPLRVGCFSWPPLFTPNKTGWAREIADWVCSLIGHAKPVYIEVPFYKAEDWIHSQEIDLFAPLMMALPGRLSRLGFSEPLPDVWVGLCGVVHSQYKQRAFQDGNLQPDEVHLVTSAREVAAILAERARFSNAITSEIHSEYDKGSRGHSAELLEELVDKPLVDEPEVAESSKYGSRRVRVILTTQVSFAGLPEDIKSELRAIPIKELNGFRFPLSFACSPDEPRLLQAINQALRIMRESGKLGELLKKREKELSEAGLLRNNQDINGKEGQ